MASASARVDGAYPGLPLVSMQASSLSRSSSSIPQASSTFPKQETLSVSFLAMHRFTHASGDIDSTCAFKPSAYMREYPCAELAKPNPWIPSYLHQMHAFGIDLRFAVMPYDGRLRTFVRPDLACPIPSGTPLGIVPGRFTICEANGNVSDPFTKIALSIPKHSVTVQDGRKTRLCLALDKRDRQNFLSLIPYGKGNVVCKAEAIKIGKKWTWQAVVITSADLRAGEMLSFRPDPFYLNSPPESRPPLVYAELQNSGRVRRLPRPIYVSNSAYSEPPPSSAAMSTERQIPSRETTSLSAVSLLATTALMQSTEQVRPSQRKRSRSEYESAQIRRAPDASNTSPKRPASEVLVSRLCRPLPSREVHLRPTDVDTRSISYALADQRAAAFSAAAYARQVFIIPPPLYGTCPSSYRTLVHQWPTASLTQPLAESQSSRETDAAEFALGFSQNTQAAAQASREGPLSITERRTGSGAEMQSPIPPMPYILFGSDRLVSDHGHGVSSSVHPRLRFSLQASTSTGRAPDPRVERTNQTG